MKVVVITGSTRGIGRGLAENFLHRGCKVVIAGRQQGAVDLVVEELAQRAGADNVAVRPVKSPVPHSYRVCGTRL